MLFVTKKICFSETVRDDLFVEGVFVSYMKFNEFQEKVVKHFAVLLFPLIELLKVFF